MAQSINIFSKIQELLSEFPGNVTIQEKRIDASVQMEYNQCAEAIRPDLDTEEILRTRNDLFVRDTPVEIKKELLVQLASIDHIDAFRTLEKFARSQEFGLADWAALALQENKLLLQSRLLDENHVLISTGLGARGMKIRYFTVIFTKTGRSFSGFEKKLLESEIQFSFKTQSSEIETIHFEKDLCMVISLIPIKISIHKLFDSFIEECNQYDDFLNPHYLITNVKIFSAREIRKMLRRSRAQKNPEIK